MDLEKLFDLADRNKDLRFGIGKLDYRLANAAFAVLLDRVINYSEPLIGLELETDDPEGRSEHEAYYDLVVMHLGKRSLCIPLPLLKPCSVATVVKRARRVERGTHARETREPAPGEVVALWREFLRTPIDGDLYRQVEMHLMEAAEVQKAINYYRQV